jgi:hypothetical protein
LHDFEYFKGVATATSRLNGSLLRITVQITAIDLSAVWWALATNQRRGDDSHIAIPVNYRRKFEMIIMATMSKSLAQPRLARPFRIPGKRRRSRAGHIRNERIGPLGRVADVRARGV